MERRSTVALSEILIDTPNTKDSSKDDDGYFDDVRRHAEEKLLKAYETRLYHSGIPPRYKDYILGKTKEQGLGAAWGTDDCKQAALEAAHAMVEHGYTMLFYGQPKTLSVRHALLLSGGFGTGKTTLACAILKRFMWQHQIDGSFIKFYDFIRRVQSGYADGTASTVLREFQQIPVLVLDDIGDVDRPVSQTENRKELFFEVLDYRNDYLLPTILTTNLDEKALIAQFSERTFTRIMEMARMIKLGGRNFRL